MAASAIEFSPLVDFSSSQLTFFLLFLMSAGANAFIIRETFFFLAWIWTTAHASCKFYFLFWSDLNVSGFKIDIAAITQARDHELVVVWADIYMACGIQIGACADDCKDNVWIVRFFGADYTYGSLWGFRLICLLGRECSCIVILDG